jgi:hypothetical protein
LNFQVLRPSGGIVAEIQRTASYVRQGSQHSLDEQQVLRSLQHRTGVESPDFTNQIWELLKTPQTAKSLARALSVDEQSRLHQIEDVLEQLFDAELIEVAPDS